MGLFCPQHPSRRYRNGFPGGRRHFCLPFNYGHQPAVAPLRRRVAFISHLHSSSTTTCTPNRCYGLSPHHLLDKVKQLPIPNLNCSHTLTFRASIQPFASSYSNTLQIACPMLLGAAPSLPQKKQGSGLQRALSTYPYVHRVYQFILFCFLLCFRQSYLITETGLRHSFYAIYYTLPIYPSGTLSSNPQPRTEFAFLLRYGASWSS